MKISSLLLSLLLAGSVTAAVQVAPLSGTGSAPYQAIRLTPAVYQGANSDLSDLLVKNAAGENVPYFIHSGGESLSQQQERYPMKLLDAVLKKDGFYFDYKVATTPNQDVLATSLMLETTDKNFAKDVELLGSYDNRHWNTVQQDVLYCVEGNSKLSLTFAQPLKYTYYRLKLSNNLEQISFFAAELQYNAVARQQEYFYEEMRPAFTVEEEGKDTLLHLQGLKNLELESITLETEDMFRRQVAAPFGEAKELYNLTFEAVSYHDTTLSLQGQKSSEDLLTLRIHNNDDKPIHVTGVQVVYMVDEVVFAAKQGEAFTLHFGTPNATPPVYDIHSYKNEILKGPIDYVSIGQIETLPTAQTPKDFDYSIIFNVVVVAVAALLGLLLLLRLRKQSK